MTLTDEQIAAYVAKLRAQRLAAGLPEYIVSERLHQLIAHVMATHATKAEPKPSLRATPQRQPDESWPA